jgi:hypothetical protein
MTLDEMFAREFEDAFQTFVDTGGLERVTCLDEGWERRYRTQVLCSHLVKRQECSLCKVTRAIYGT